MKDAVDHLKDRNPKHSTQRPDQSEVAEAYLQSGLREGLSMEWMLDRYSQTSNQNEGRM